MGTNYYVKKDTCDTCGRHEEIHLGKSSWGWQFSFQYNGGQFYKNIREMKKWLKDKRIKNEYNEEVTYEEFWKMVKDKQIKKNLNHAAYCHKEYPYSKDTNFIINGYSFTDGWFS